MTALFSSPHTAMEAARPGSRSRSTDVFCGWFKDGAQRAGRQTVGPAVFPAPAFHGRSAINPCGPTGGRQAVHQYQTQGDAHEATRAGIARPGGRRKSLGRERFRPDFEAPGAGLPYDGPNPQNARTTGHLNTQPIEGDDS